MQPPSQEVASFYESEAPVLEQSVKCSHSDALETLFLLTKFPTSDKSALGMQITRHIMDPFDRELRPISEIPPTYRSVFAGYPTFNRIQSAVLDEVLQTDKSLVISAPTGSGKTAIFEMAMIRALCQNESSAFSDLRMVYSKYKAEISIISLQYISVSPMKALCQERHLDWNKKFSSYGLKIICITSDYENFNMQLIFSNHIILCTPEKWDILTRKWREYGHFVRPINLFMIDEVHLLNADVRGPTLEVAVCRMKTIETFMNANNPKIRFIALSATIANVEDVADWISGSCTTQYYKFSEEIRPVKLNKIVLGYPINSQVSSLFRFDMSLSYKLPSLILKYSEGKPTLIFCNTRKSVEMTAKLLVEQLQIHLSEVQKQALLEVLAEVNDPKLQKCAVHGIGFHHAGLIMQNRRAIENAFRECKLPILVTTSTLAMGVNLPARLVIVKTTKSYDGNGRYKDYDEISLFQMIGRAGRIQFDTQGTAIILTTSQDKEKYEKMLNCAQPIESQLHKCLMEHLNAEIVLKTITDLDVAMRWLSSTFLYIRARKNPEKYKLPRGLKPDQIDKKLLEICQVDLNKLSSGGMIKIMQGIEITPTVIGEIMAKYYVAFDTMKLFTKLNGNENLIQVLGLISQCHEFSEIFLRVNDKKVLNFLNHNSSKEEIRFRLKGRIKTVDMKVNCIIQAVLGNLEISEQSIISDSHRIMRNCERIARCNFFSNARPRLEIDSIYFPGLIEYLETRSNAYQALLSAIIMAKCFHAQLWENSPYVSKQLSGIGPVISRQLSKSEKNTFQKIANTNPRQLEMITAKKPPFGNQIIDQVQHLPRYEIKLEVSDTNIKLTIALANVNALKEKCSVNFESTMTLLVGNSKNEILLYEKYTHECMIHNPEVIRNIELEKSSVEFVAADFISDDWVGIDCSAKCELTKNKPPKNYQDPNPGQTFLDMYATRQKGNNNKITATNSKSRSVEENHSARKKKPVKEANPKTPTNASLEEKHTLPETSEPALTESGAKGTNRNDNVNSDSEDLFPEGEMENWDEIFDKVLSEQNAADETEKDKSKCTDVAKIDANENIPETKKYNLQNTFEQFFDPDLLRLLCEKYNYKQSENISEVEDVAENNKPKKIESENENSKSSRETDNKPYSMDKPDSTGNEMPFGIIEEIENKQIEQSSEFNPDSDSLLGLQSKTIRWRSPLIHSPPKFGLLNFPKVNSREVHRQGHTFSYFQGSDETNTTVRSVRTPTHSRDRQNESRGKTKFPLSDRECYEAELATSSKRKKDGDPLDVPNISIVEKNENLNISDYCNQLIRSQKLREMEQRKPRTPSPTANKSRPSLDHSKKFETPNRNLNRSPPFDGYRENDREQIAFHPNRYPFRDANTSQMPEVYLAHPNAIYKPQHRYVQYRQTPYETFSTNTTNCACCEKNTYSAPTRIVDDINSCHHTHLNRFHNPYLTPSLPSANQSLCFNRIDEPLMQSPYLATNPHHHWPEHCFPLKRSPYDDMCEQENSKRDEFEEGYQARQMEHYLDRNAQRVIDPRFPYTERHPVQLSKPTPRFGNEENVAMRDGFPSPPFSDLSSVNYYPYRSPLLPRNAEHQEKEHRVRGGRFDLTGNDIRNSYGKPQKPKFLPKNNAVSNQLKTESFCTTRAPKQTFVEQQSFEHRLNEMTVPHQQTLMYRGIITDRQVRHNRPDIVVLDKKKKEGFLIEVSIPLDENVAKVRTDKITKYQDLAHKRKSTYHLAKVSIIPIIISANGIVEKEPAEVFTTFGYRKLQENYHAGAEGDNTGHVQHSPKVNVTVRRIWQKELEATMEEIVIDDDNNNESPTAAAAAPEVSGSVPVRVSRCRRRGLRGCQTYNDYDDGDVKQQ
ncbi:uncharacterized protein LOC132700928 [Cylas formicarius]|uniref:uncharacterized protein LOC132700928 n=1 Tax=Cylas formicarius TaxID=197179 RepID=UPI002958D0D2|nr:uncharacterized protein LOC132700928 [Cylas formicarius]